MSSRLRFFDENAAEVAGSRARHWRNRALVGGIAALSFAGFFGFGGLVALPLIGIPAIWGLGWMAIATAGNFALKQFLARRFARGMLARITAGRQHGYYNALATSSAPNAYTPRREEGAANITALREAFLKLATTRQHDPDLAISLAVARRAEGASLEGALDKAPLASVRIGKRASIVVAEHALEQMTPDALRLALAHEMAHVLRNDTMTRIPLYSLSRSARILATGPLLVGAPLMLLPYLTACAIAKLGYNLTSRLAEQDADRFALAVGRAEGWNAESYIATFERGKEKITAPLEDIRAAAEEIVAYRTEAKAAFVAHENDVSNFEKMWNAFSKLDDFGLAIHPVNFALKLILPPVPRDHARAKLLRRMEKKLG